MLLLAVPKSIPSTAGKDGSSIALSFHRRRPGGGAPVQRRESGGERIDRRPQSVPIGEVRLRSLRRRSPSLVVEFRALGQPQQLVLGVGRVRGQDRLDLLGDRAL